MSCFDSAESRRAARLLEFPALLEDLARHCALARAAVCVHASEPTYDAAFLRQQWDWVSELSAWLAKGEELALGDMLDLPACIGPERNTRGPLDGAELAAVGGAAAALHGMREHLLRNAEALSLSAALVRDGSDLSPLATHLAASLEPDGRLRDEASPALRSLRAAVRSAEQRWRQSAQRALADANARGIGVGGELVMRGERFCVAVRAEQRKQLPGIVHDRSGTGQTVFIEPIAVVEAGNEWVEARLSLSAEEARLLAALNQTLSNHVPQLLAAFAAAVQLDEMRARARFGQAHRGLRPRFVAAQKGLRLSGFRHPSLSRSLGAQSVVPLTIELDGQRRLLLVTGPNAGGKTVAMKAVGLAVLMAQSAVPLPAEIEPSLPIFRRVFVESGDDQSIADALSSFSAHLTHLREILRQTDESSLLLLDELGSGTDPREGVALARAAIEAIDAVGAFAIISTHYGELKALVQELPTLRNASMSFDSEQLRPRFTLQLDRPGASHALEIARRLELPASLLERARSLIDHDHLRYDEMLGELEREQINAAAARTEAARLRDEAAQRQREYDERIQELRRQRKQQLRNAQSEAEGILRNARASVERLLDRIRQAKDLDEAKARAAEARQSLDASATRLAEAARPPRRGSALREDQIEMGMRLRHLALGVMGTVVERRGSRVTLELGGRRMTVDAADLGRPEGGEQIKSPPVALRTDLADPPPDLTRIDVRGLDGLDAWSAVDKALDRCILQNRHRLEVVHGKGSGALRRQLGEQLQRDTRVRRAAVGGDGEFDEGVTVVEL